MNGLRIIQQQLSAHMRHGDMQAADLIVETASVPRATRLRIYAHAYIARLEEVLRSNYPKLHLVLGDEDFMTLTQDYLAAHPSQRRSVRWLGDTLADFLATGDAYAEAPVLAELARLEWALGTAFDAADAPTLSAAALGELADDDWPILAPRFHPALTVLSLQWNAIAVWQALDKDEEPPRPAEAAGGWAVWRDELVPHFRSLAQDETALMLALQQGEVFGAACEKLLAWHSEDEAPGIAAGYLGRWLADGWISALDTKAGA